MVGWDPPQAQPRRRAALPAQQRKAGPESRGLSAQKASLSSGNHGRRRACIPPAAGLLRKRVKWSQRNVALRPPSPPPRPQSPAGRSRGQRGTCETSSGLSGSGKPLRARPAPSSRPTRGRGCEHSLAPARLRARPPLQPRFTQEPPHIAGARVPSKLLWKEPRPGRSAPSRPLFVGQEGRAGEPSTPCPGEGAEAARGAPTGQPGERWPAEGMPGVG